MSKSSFVRTKMALGCGLLLSIAGGFVDYTPYFKSKLQTVSAAPTAVITTPISRVDPTVGLHFAASRRHGAPPLVRLPAAGK
jgi:hypothetical protein